MGQDHFSGIELLVGTGRFKEAVGAVRRSVLAGAPLWESCIWLGRIEENRGRADEAERFFRKAMSADPASPMPRAELSRLLEKVGRSDEARVVMAEAAVQASRDFTVRLDAVLREGASRSFGVRLLEFLEFAHFRKAFVENLMGGSLAPRRIEAALRGVLGGKPSPPGARILLVEILIARGKSRQAESELAAAFLPDSKGVEGSRIEVLLALIDLGRYGPALEQAVLSCISRAAADERLALEWEQLFSALMCAKKYRAAFRLGEAMLDRRGGFDSPLQLMWPWWRQCQRGVAEVRFIGEELSRIRSAGRRGDFPQWFSYYRAILTSFLGIEAEAMREYGKIGALESPRYLWMRQSFILVKLGLLDFDGAIGICRDILKQAPGHWWVRCRMGEAYLAKGDELQGLREFELALDAAAAKARGEVLTWHGEILLWLGQYEKALEKLDEAVGLGARTFVFGWRGAARLKLGDRTGALADLDLAVALDPKDFEARGWRGEAYRIMGRHAEAVREFDHIVAAGGASFWIYFNRALSRDALGDESGLADDYMRIGSAVTAFIKGALGLAQNRALSSGEMRRVLTAGLERAHGIRRGESFVQPLWMRPRV